MFKKIPYNICSDKKFLVRLFHAYKSPYLKNATIKVVDHRHLCSKISPLLGFLSASAYENILYAGQFREGKTKFDEKWEWCIYNSWIDSSPGFLARMTAVCRQTTTCACNTSKNKNEKKKILIKQSFPEWIYTSCRISSFVLFCNVSYNTDMIGEWLLKQEFPLFSVSATGLF